MPQLQEDQLFDLIGEGGFTRLVAAFYRQIPSDPVLGPMYTLDDLPGAELRLRNFLIFRFGGPSTYIEERGHPRLRMRHAPFPIGTPARDRWVELMDNALAEAQLPGDALELLRSFFHSTATFLINRQSPPTR
ncbi:MAG: globin [Acidobacteria bacterium]|nr:globin [Acidobacteriota bacterium]